MTRKLEVKDLLAFRLVGDVNVAPAGDRVAYVVNRVDQEKNEYQTSIYVAAPGNEPVRFTGGETDSTPRFSPDGSRLAFVSRRSGQPQVWLMSTAGGEASQLTRVQGGVREFAWAPDGGRIAFVANLKADGIQPEVKEEKEEDLLKQHTRQVKLITEQFHKLDGVGHFGERRGCLCVISLEDGAAPVQLTHPPYQVSDLAWTPDGQTILFGGRLGPDYDKEAFDQFIYAIAANGEGEARVVTPAGLSAGNPAVSPDGRTLAFGATKPEGLGYNNPRLYTMPIGGGQPTPVTPGYDRPLGNVGLSDMPAPGGGRLTWSPDGQSLFALSSVDGTVHVVRISLQDGSVTPVTKGDRMVYTFGLDRQCRKAAAGIADPLGPGDIYFVDVTEGTEQRLTRINEALLSEVALSEPTRFYAQAEGGPRVDGWVIKPHSYKEGQRYPAILSIHGGPMMMYAAAFFFEFQLLAAQGYGVIYSNPRGSQGYGEEFCSVIRHEWGNKDYADVMAILDQAVSDNAWIDTDRLGITGGSYGGFMTNWIVTHNQRFKAAVTGRSICDWRTMSLTTDGTPYWIRRARGAMPWSGDDWYRQQSPITYVENVTTPILIEHQEGDLRCPIDQGIMWYSAIKYLGKAPVRFVTYPGEFHGMSRNGKPWNRIHRLGEIVAWFDTYLAAQ